MIRLFRRRKKIHGSLSSLASRINELKSSLEMEKKFCLDTTVVVEEMKNYVNEDSKSL